MLDTLPDDVLLVIVVQLETARDIRALLLANRRLASLFRSDDESGWRAFVRARFPTTPIPFVSSPSPSSYPKWGELARSLTWQSRAWQRRSLYFQGILPEGSYTEEFPRRRQGTPYHPVIDAHYDFAAKEELLVWGAGENLIARRRRLGREGSSLDKVVWHRLEGKDLGYSAGRDDIRAVSVLDGVGDDLGALVGRDNGNLVLLDLSEKGFGKKLADFSPEFATVDETEEFGPTTRFNQGTINSIDVSGQKRLVAAATRAGVQLYHLPEEAGANIQPSAYLDLATHHFDLPNTTLGHARWVGEDLMAFALQGCEHQLRYAAVTPTGIETLSPYKNPDLEERFDINYEKGKLCTHSLAPIDASSVPGGNSSLLLAAWRDGTVRLQDLRTQSPSDLVYCDNVDPWSEFESLLPFGTSHFVAGGAVGATVKVFDFRWPKNYYHTTALPCSPEKPFPNPIQHFLKPPPSASAERRDQCIAGLNDRRCTWHELSRELYYRPNGTLFFSKALPPKDVYACVWSMARSSPLAPNFYIGISGAMVEVSLSSVTGGYPDVVTTEFDPVFGFPLGEQHDAGGAGYATSPLEPMLMETGDGMMYNDNHTTVRVPPMRGKEWNNLRKDEDEDIPQELRARHRLDERYHIKSDFAGNSDSRGVEVTMESLLRQFNVRL
jgi:hypothetical protein